MPRDPQPIAEDHVGRPAHQSDLRGLGRGEFGNLDVETGFPVQSTLIDDRKFPGEGSVFLQRETELVGGFGFTIEKDRQHEVKRRPAKVAREGAPAIGTPRAVARRKAFC